MAEWNPWHGCKKYSPGCMHCYVYRRDEKYQLDASQVRKNADFDLPVRKGRDGRYKLQPPEIVYTCFTSDFLLDQADAWRADAWRMMKTRSDLHFLFITKRILRFREQLPDDWNDGYPNVTIGVTCENQEKANERLPYFLQLPIRHRLIICEPMLEAIDLRPFLGKSIEQVVVGGESGNDARMMRYQWAVSVHDQCREANVSFYFKQTGALFEKSGRLYHVERKYQSSQARKSGLSFDAETRRAFE